MVTFNSDGEMTMIDRSIFLKMLVGAMVCIVCYQQTSVAQQAQVSTTDRLFVDLPGSYGGRLYYDSPAAAQLMQCRVLVDSVPSNGQNFQRDYWTVYAGMGMWDCVINCYTRDAGGYHVVSLVQQLRLGKPGEVVDGASVTADELRVKALAALRDTSNVRVKEFTKMLDTVQINK
jgi:hypothetical protein